MVVVTSRQAGPRPETIRTRLARFMPNRSAGWSIAWSTQTERPEEIANDDELRAAEHLGCYGAAVAHALGQASISPTRLRVTAEAAASISDGAAQPITVEIRVQIPRPSTIEANIVEAIARRADPSCPVWRSLASELGIRVIAFVDEPTPSAEPTQAESASTPRASMPITTRRPTLPQLSMSMPSLGAISLPRLLTPRMAILIGVAVGAFMVAPKPFLS